MPLLRGCIIVFLCGSGAQGDYTTLQGLFRSAQHKKQAEFLGRSFDSDKDRAAAAKNAFVLLAQHRPQLAAAFFILGAASKPCFQLKLLLGQVLASPSLTPQSFRIVPSSTSLQSRLAAGWLHSSRLF